MSISLGNMCLGAQPLGDQQCEFIMLAPQSDQLSVRVVSPEEELLPMKRMDHGYWRLLAKQTPPGADYYYRLDDSQDRPDWLVIPLRGLRQLCGE